MLWGSFLDLDVLIRNFEACLSFDEVVFFDKFIHGVDKVARCSQLTIG